MLALTSSIETPLHRVSAGVKLAALTVFTGILMSSRSYWIIGSGAACVIALYALGGSAFLRAGVRSLKPLAIFVVVLIVWHLVTDTIAHGTMLAGRMLATVAMANLVTLTTRLDDMISVLQSVLSPLRVFGVSGDMLGLAIGLVVRFTAVFIEKANALSEAWRARSARRPSWSIVLPLFTSALDDADHVSDAIRARSAARDD